MGKSGKDTIILRIWTIIWILGVTVYLIFAEIRKIVHSEGESEITFSNIAKIAFSPVMIPAGVLAYIIYREFLSGRESIFQGKTLCFSLKSWLQWLIIWLPLGISIFLSPFLIEKGMYTAGKLCALVGVIILACLTFTMYKKKQL